ncbi:MAG: putative tryptophan/tyrosine transport system substrate-binding protein [Candidatus Dependentiae bacterium]|nr:putative tryptophan/tyrosine transport system substrate-binding protein [Candidatus Dependentiae bacterium]
MAQKKPYLIALLTPVGMGMHGQVMSGLMGSPYVRSDAFRVYHFFTRGLSEAAIRVSVEQILESRFSAIITLGLSCALVTKKILEEKHVKIPHIFVGINDPFSVGLGENPEDLVAHHMTGVLYNAYETEKATQFLCEVKPSMKSVLIALENISVSGAHGRIDWVDQEMAKVRSVCEPRGITVSSYAASSLADLYSYVANNLDTFDTLMLLEGSTTLNIYESLGSLCSKNKKTLFSGLIEPVAKSAAIGYGASYESMGEYAAEYAYKLAVEGVPLQKLPLIRDLKGRQPVVNLAVGMSQDIDGDHAEAVCRAWDGLIFRTIL